MKPTPLVLLASIVSFAFAANTVSSTAAPRTELSLNGSWEYQVVRELLPPPAGEGWKPCNVPGVVQGYDYKRAWFRRSFNAPPAMRGKRLQLNFWGVKFNSQVVLNGKNVGGCFGGYEPFELDVTEAVRFDAPNELRVGCHDWTGVFAPGKVDFSRAGRGGELRSLPSDKILSPVGGRFEDYGIWDDVTLTAHEPVYVKDLFIQPSVRNRELVVEYTVANESPVGADLELKATVEEGDKSVLELGPVRLRVAAGQTTTHVLKAPWPNPRLWSHADPYLYQLRTALSTGDALRTRFGFREFWVDGPDFVLNGSKIHLLASAGWPVGVPTERDGIRRLWQGVKDAGCVAFRTHTQPWRRVYYDVADEVGLLMIPEGAVFNDDDSYRIFDPVFWTNYAGHLQAMVRNHKNHPSVVMWSLENEFWGGRLNDRSPAKDDLVRLGGLMKQWDPTRPIFYESDGDPGGVADAIGLHYPHEYPFYTCWPNEAWWLAKPQELPERFHNGEPRFLWRKDKPLYIGEYLWIPSSDPSWNSVFLGDEAYIDYQRGRKLAQAESWKMQILGYRHFGVSGQCPWTMMDRGVQNPDGSFNPASPLYEAVRYGYQAIAAYSHDYDRRFFSGEKVKRRVEVFNDVLDASQLTLAWTLTAHGRVADRGQKELALAPAGQQMLEVTLAMPEVTARTGAEWQLTLTRQGRRVFEDTHRFAIFPRTVLPQVTARLGLFDAAGRTRALFAAGGLRPTSIDSLERIDPALELLVIGAEAWRPEPGGDVVIGREPPARAALMEFVRRGGRLLVLEQAAYPEGLFDNILSDHQSTMTFPLRPSHPVLRGVEADDLKFWRGDHLVTTAEPPRPDAGGARTIIVSGSAAGLDHAPLLEQFIGSGCIILSQLRLVEKWSSEPTAARILANLLSYLDQFRSAPRKMAVVGGNVNYRKRLRELGLSFDERADSAGMWADYSLVLCRGTLGEAPGSDLPARLRAFVERGGNLFVHRPTPETLATLRRIFALDLESQPYPGPVTRTEGGHPLSEVLAREDVYWLGEPGAMASATPRAEQMADGVFTRSLTGKPARSYEVETWKLNGHLVERQSPGVVFATAGSASTEIEFPETGAYIIGVVARGTPCLGVYPLVEVTVGGKVFGIVATSSNQWQTVSAMGRAEKGQHEVKIAFVNDESRPPDEDRNLYVDKVLIAPADDLGGISFLTTPPTTAVAQRGRGMIVIDQLCWDTEERNHRKAARYASSLLEALGAPFTSRCGVAVQCEQMAPDPGVTLFSRDGGYATLPANGVIRTRIQVAETAAYSLELVASGTQVTNVYPLVDVQIDGRKVGSIQLTQAGWRAYPLALELTRGPHELGLAFVNDAFIPGVADRNVQMDKVVFYRTPR